ncbi:hypothetical protein KCV07_g7121, partial [Aureobasidium melanogenum]
LSVSTAANATTFFAEDLTTRRGHHGKPIRSPITTVEAPPLAPRTRRINFLDLPSEVRNLVYFYLYRDRIKRTIDLCVLSPAWKSPSPPTAFMNTCSTIASGLMPLYFSNCLFTIDTSHEANARLLTEAFKWLKKVGENSSAHFRRLHIIHEQTQYFSYEITITVTDKKEVSIEELKDPAKYLAWRLARERLPGASQMQPEHKDIYSRIDKLDKQLTDDLIERLVHRINTNETGALGVTEFELILKRISFHLAGFRRGEHCRNRRGR